ncbi:MAG: hypothetical protein GQ564_18435, partial [Bacteroidales bacterium]|nr:hypothetical protein [Bacteroidales bacterium]
MRKNLLVCITLLSILITLTSNAQEWQEISKTLPLSYNNNYHYYGRSTSIDGDYAVVGANSCAYVIHFKGNSWNTIAKLTSAGDDAPYNFGCSVSIAGDNIVIGAYGANRFNGSKEGKAYVFTKPSGGWTNMTETAILSPSDWDWYDHFGISVSISGESIVVGATNDETSPGSAYVFTKPSGGWKDMTETAKLKSSTGRAMGFGKSVDISGENIIVGGSEEGVVYIFEKPTGGWEDTTETIRLVNLEGTDYSFGNSVSISNNHIVISSNYDGGEFAYVFEKPTSGWEDCFQIAKLEASNPNDNDEFGHSINIDGNQIVIGANQTDNDGFNSGSAYVFEKPVTGWRDATETAILSASNAAKNDEFGSAVSISGDRIIVTASGYNFDGSYNNCYIYEKPQGGWINNTETFLTEPLIFNGLMSDYGSVVAIDGDYAVIGAPNEEFYTGSVYVLYFNGITWETKARLTASDGNILNFFGISVGISGDNIIIGAPNNDYNIGNFYKSAYVFTKPESGWGDMEETAKLTASDASDGDSFGYSVGIFGDNIVIGACGEGDGDLNGAAYVFTKADGGWENMTETAKLTTSEEYSGFGIATDIYKDYIIVGAKKTISSNVDYSGAAFIYEKSSNGWLSGTETAKLLRYGSQDDDRFGHSVSISDNYAVVGAYREHKDYIFSCGSVYVYKKPSNGWTSVNEIAKLTVSDPGQGSHFGHSVSISGDNIIVGAPCDTYSDFKSGIAYLFKKPLGEWCNINETYKFMPSNQDSNIKFGESVSIFGKHFVVGAPEEYIADTASGTAYFYTQSDYYFNNNICEGDNFEFVIVNSEDGAAFRWQENTGSTWVDINGEANDTLIISDITLGMNAYQYRCIFSGTSDDTTGVATLKVNPTYYNSENITICSGSDHTFPDGTIQNNITSQVNYTSNLQTVLGCDSVIETTLNVSSNPVYNLTETGSICSDESYTFPDGTTQKNITTQVIYVSNLQTVFGCDSIIETTVNVNPIYNLSETVLINSGDSYTFPDGTEQNYITSQVIYTSNLLTDLGCDSIIETTVKIDCNPFYNLTELVSVCHGADCTFPDGTTQSNITAQVVYTSNLQTVFGCDSIIKTTVNVNPIYSLSESVSIKRGSDYTFPDEAIQNNITSQVIYTSNLQTIYGCDSIIETTVNVEQIQECLFTEVFAVCSGSDYLFPDGTLQSNITSQVVHESIIPSLFACDTIIETTVNVNQGDVTYLNETICEGETFQLGYAILSSPGLYGVTLTNQYGCD